MFCPSCGIENLNGAKFCRSCGNQFISSIQTQVESRFTPEEYYKRQRGNRILGVLSLVIPPITLALTLSAYAIASFVAKQMVTSTDDQAALSQASATTTTFQIINVALSLIGVVAVVGIIVGIPLGIIFLSKRNEMPGMKYDSRSGKGSASEIPKEIAGWNWGAAGLTWIWGASHRVWISFIMFIPLVNLVFWIYLGSKGNELAWRADNWESIEKFLEVQRKWKPWGIVFFVLGILATISRFAGAVSGN